MAYLHASKASALWGEETATATLTSPIASLPTRWTTLTPFVSGHLRLTSSSVSAMLLSAIAGYASYSIAVTEPASLLSLTVPRKRATAPAPGSATEATTSPGSMTDLVSRAMSSTSHGREEGHSVALRQPLLSAGQLLVEREAHPRGDLVQARVAPLRLADEVPHR